MIKVLNLYAGIGGNRKLWPSDEIEVTAIENNSQIAAIYQDFFPNDKVIVEDAHDYLLNHFEEFDFIWSSPPCPTHSIMRWKFVNANMTKKSKKNYQPKYADMRLYEEIILLMKHKHVKKWVVENVRSYYKPLIKPQEIGRHYLWSNFIINDINLPTEKINQSIVRDISLIKGINTNFDVENKLTVIRNCVNPKLGLHVFNCAFKLKQSKLGE